jgi:hypothetical protein
MQRRLLLGEAAVESCSVILSDWVQSPESHLQLPLTMHLALEGKERCCCDIVVGLGAG